MNNFHVLLGLDDGTVRRFVRDNSAVAATDWQLAPWSQSADHGLTGDSPVHVSMVVSGYRNLEAVVTTANGLLQHWIRQPSGEWLRWATIPPSGPPINAPSLVQGTYRAPGQTVGNLELLVPIQQGEFGPWVIGHFYQDNRDGARQWYGPTATFGGTDARFVALIQGDYGDPVPPGDFSAGPGNLECVVVGGSNQMQHWWRTQGFHWHPGKEITDLNQNGGAAGNPLWRLSVHSFPATCIKISRWSYRLTETLSRIIGVITCQVACNGTSVANSA